MIEHIATYLENPDQYGIFAPLVVLVLTAYLSVAVLHAVIFFGFNQKISGAATIHMVLAVASVISLFVLSVIENGPLPANSDLGLIGWTALCFAVFGLLFYGLFVRKNVVRPHTGWAGKRSVVLTGNTLTAEGENHKRANSDHGPREMIQDFGNDDESISRIWTEGSLKWSWARLWLANLCIVLGIFVGVVALGYDVIDIRTTTEEIAGKKTDSIPIYRVFGKGKSSIADIKTSAMEHEVRKILDFGPDRIEVHGHTDTDGTAERNMVLSQDRANAVRDWLLMQDGLKHIKITAIGHGETEQVSPEERLSGDDLLDAQRLNRRVEIVMIKD